LTALDASLQSNVIGCATVAPLAGESRLGVPGVGGGAVEITVSATEALRCSRPPMLTEVVVGTDEVEIEKLALVAPAPTVTLDGTVATEVFPLNSWTTAPPVGAGLARVTVPVDEVPPLTLVGLSAIEINGGAAEDGGPTVRFRFALLAP